MEKKGKALSTAAVHSSIPKGLSRQGTKQIPIDYA